MTQSINLPAILIADGFGAFLAIMMLGARIWKSGERQKEGRLIRLMLWTALISCVSEMFAFGFDGRDGMGAKIAVYVSNYWLFFSNMVLGTLWIVVLISHINNDKLPKPQVVVIAFLDIVGTVTLLANIFAPVAFYINDNNAYVRGPVFWIFIGIEIAFTIDGVATYFVVRNRSKESVYFPVWQFVIPILIGIAIQTLVYGVSTICPSIVIATCGLILGLFNESEAQAEIIRMHEQDTKIILEQRKNELERTKELATRLEQIKGLANEYDTLHFVDLDTDSFSLYYSPDSAPFAHKEMTEVQPDFSHFYTDSIEAFCHPDFRAHMIRYADPDFIRHILRTQSKHTYRFLMNTNDGYKWCEYALIKLDDELNSSRVAVGFTNINDIVEKEEEQKQALTNALEAARAANSAKTEFLFSMSHDIRTPMNAILGYADMALRHEDDSQRVNDSLKKIKSSGGHLLSLINDILEMSRIESGILEIKEEPFDIYDGIESVSHMSEALAVSKDIEFTTVVGEIKNRYIFADELHVNEVLINLISNAVKYNNIGGKVEFRMDQISDVWGGRANYRFTVKDNGLGMSEEFQKHLYESFARENTSTISKQEGSGLGLAIVKRIIDFIGGNIDVESKKGEGTLFTIELSFRVMSEEEEEAFKETKKNKNDLEKAWDFSGTKALLVEDNDMNREIARELLEDVGIVVDEAEDGEIAVKKVTANGVGYYDFILMDIQMPVMNGYEATSVIRSISGGDAIPIIALSANAFVEDINKSLDAGMNSHVAKPINVEELFTVLKDCK